MRQDHNSESGPKRTHARPHQSVFCQTKFKPRQPTWRKRIIPTALGQYRPDCTMDDGLLGAFMTESPSPVLKFENLTLGYNHHPAVHHLQGEISKGSLLAVVGPNGAGKSSLLKGITGELKPMQGKIYYPGLPRKNIAYLPQQSSLDTSFPIGIRDFVAMGLWRQLGAFRGIDKKSAQRLEQAIETTGLSGLEDRPIGQISGGQLQRARFAQVMLQDSPLVLLDEPFAAIDDNTVRDLTMLIKHWNHEGRTIISVLHDLAYVRQEYPQTLILAREVVAHGETDNVLTEENLARARQKTAPPQGRPKLAVCRTDDNISGEHGDR